MYNRTLTHTVCIHLRCAQGYKIIGSHSAVKLCRWTKSMLRGRGGCYKHTLYGAGVLVCSMCLVCH